MAFRPPKKRPRFADLLVILAQTKDIDDALYQTVQEIINRLDQFSTVTGEQISSGGGGGGGGPLGPHAPTHYSDGADPVVVTNLAGYLGDITKYLRSDGTFQIPPGGSGGGTTPSPHATTHEPGGSDTMAVDAIPATGSLRTLGSGPNQAASGNDSRLTNARTPTAHAPTHSQGGTDAVDVKNLTGYPGGTTTFLRADKTFAAPPTGGGTGMNLDYLGDYVAGTYNDGDIVVASDGIAYMCVVDGTTTAPEPWPGVGVATAVGPPGPPGPPGPTGPPGENAGFDATYWTVSPHTALANERAMNSLANGYVKSTAGEPSTVALIPISDTTGTVPDARLSANVALKNIDNLFSATQTLPSSSYISGTNGILNLRDTTSGVDLKMWRFLGYSNGNLYLEAVTDGITGVLQQFVWGRNGVMGAQYFQGDGRYLTNLDGGQITIGTVATARLGGGVANYTTYLRGDQVWAPITDIFPSGLIVLSLSPCPIGWTRVVWDGNFIRVGPTPGAAGGAWDHTHGVGSYAVNNHNHGGSVSVNISGGTSNAGGHSHGYGGSTSGTTNSNNQGEMNSDAGGSGNMARGPHQHDFSVNFSGETNSVGGHTHSFSGSGSGGIGGDAPGINGTSAAAQHLPPFIDVFLCQKN